MKKIIVTIAITCFIFTGCISINQTPTLNDNKTFDDHLGKQVILVGELIGPKRSKLHGIYIGDANPPPDHALEAKRDRERITPPSLSDLTDPNRIIYRKVEAKGILIRNFLIHEDYDDPFATMTGSGIALSNGTNIWYDLIDPRTGNPATYKIIEY